MSIMSIIGYAIFGLVAGLIARMLHPGRDAMTWAWTMVLGLAGAVVGGYLGRFIGVSNHGLMGWVTAIGGAILLLVAYNFATSQRAAIGGPVGRGTATNDDYKQAVFDDLSRGPKL